MIKICREVIKKQTCFWKGCVFHPTDAIEDPWGKRILDQIAEDKACRTVRIYTMFEDIVYLDGNGNLCFDFRLSDLRIDYLIEKGYRLLLAYAGMPDCIAERTDGQTVAAKGKTRYKGKTWNTSPPKNPEIWEEVCYQYTKHIVERYGESVVSQWYCHCFNEADTSTFFMSTQPWDDWRERVDGYFSMYEGFVHGVRRATDKIAVGGPALAGCLPFFDVFLKRVKEKNLPLDFISWHYYGTSPEKLNDGSAGFNVRDILRQHDQRLKIVQKNGFGDKPIVVDEWGACSHGFYNRAECPKMMFRETEQYAAYYTRLLHDFIYGGYKMQELMICLSGQHEMTEDFSGFRNFFTLNFIRKPIYNAFVLAAKLGEDLVRAEKDSNHLFVVPTKTGKKKYAVLLTYATDTYTDELADREETLYFEEKLIGKTATVWCIDKEHANPYRLYQKMGGKIPNIRQISLLREEGRLKPVFTGKYTGEIKLPLSANATFLITVE